MDVVAEPWMDELPSFNAPRGCPCTAQLLCQADERHLFDADCHIPLHGERTYSMHGGAGKFSLPFFCELLMSKASVCRSCGRICTAERNAELHNSWNMFSKLCNALGS